MGAAGVAGARRPGRPDRRRAARRSRALRGVEQGRAERVHAFRRDPARSLDASRAELDPARPRRGPRALRAHHRPADHRPRAERELPSGGARAEYFPVRFLAPESPESIRALGLDSLATVGTPAAVGIARDGGELALSSPIQLGPIPADRGTALLLAVYRTGAPLRTVAQRRAALSGYVSGTWLYDQLAAPIIKLLPTGAHLQITDAGRPVFGAGQPGRRVGHREHHRGRAPLDDEGEPAPGRHPLGAAGRDPGRRADPDRAGRAAVRAGRGAPARAGRRTRGAAPRGQHRRPHRPRQPAQAARRLRPRRRRRPPSAPSA